MSAPVSGRVGELRLSLRAPAGSPGSLVRRAEGFARRVLEAVEEELETAAPGRLFRVREMALSWRLGRGELESGAAVRARARAVCERLLAEPPLPLPVPAAAASADLAVFESEGHRWAARLLAAADGDGAAGWLFAGLPAAKAPLAALCEVPPPVAWEALRRLEEAGALEGVLGSQPAAALARLAERLLPATEAAQERETRGIAEPGPATDPADALAGTPLPEPAVRLLAHLRQRRLAPAASDPGPGDAVPALRDAGRGPSSPGAPGRGLAAADPRATSAAGEPAPGTPTADSPGAPETVVPVEHGGLFYLLNPALELGLGELLWTACLDERRLLAAAFGALLGERGAGDEAVRLAAGSDAGAGPPEVPAEAQRELAPRLLAALAAALPRRRLTALPALELRLAEASSGRLLVATAAGSPFVLFAWPAAAAEELSRGVETFVGAWSRSGPRPRALPGLAPLDHSGRLEASPAPTAGTAPLLPPIPESPAAALLAQAAGCLGYLLAARCRVPHASAGELTAAYFAVAGRVVVTAERLTVRLPLAAVRLELRRAGLDRDPGWVPWLGRTVTLEYGVEQ